MAQVVQVAMGYGSNELTPEEVKQLPKDSLEIASLNVPKLVQERIKNQMVNVPTRLPRRAAKVGQVQFDYKFHLTWLVAFASDKKPWLVQIDGRGCMPCRCLWCPPPQPPRFVNTWRKWTTRRCCGCWIASVACHQARAFQIAQEREARQRAGVIQKLCEVQDFYQHLAYSPAHALEL